MFALPTRAQLIAEADEAANFVESKVVPALTFLTTNKTVVGIEQHLPDGAQVIAAMGGAEKALSFAARLVPAIGGAVPILGEVLAFANAFKALGAKPMDFADPNAPGYSDRMAREEDAG